MKVTPKGFLFLGLFCLTSALVGYVLADHYIERMPQHRGYFLVPVEDHVALPPPRPRHTVLAVIDGLRGDRAAKMQTVSKLRERGQCRIMDVGPLSVSRPVYAVLSTGLEQHRTGVRNNDEVVPIQADSIWQSARRSGLRVTAVSELPWFQQLFPNGFDSYRLVARSADHFTPSDLGDLSLIHPIYVDEEGHDHGAGSPEYAAAVARADEELGRLVARLDLDQDVMVLTADHGHTDRGGHGGHSVEVAQVLTCFAGRGILRRQDTSTLDARTLAPTLAVLLGVPLPRHLRAGQDDLDRIWEIVDASALPAPYVAERRAAISRFRLENAAALKNWLGHDGSWSDLYDRERQHQMTRALLFFLGAGLLIFVMRRRILPKNPLLFTLWGTVIYVLLCVSYTLVRGSFDLTSINKRLTFIFVSSGLCLLISVSALFVHYHFWRDREKLVLDQVRLVLLLLLCNMGHVVAFGWPLGFPLPSQIFFFLPFLIGGALMWAGILGILLIAGSALLKKLAS